MTTRYRGFLLALALPWAVLAQGRPQAVHVEVDLAGLLLRVAGNLLTDASVDDLQVRRWLPGLSVGWQWSDRLGIWGYFKPGMNLLLREAYGFGEPFSASGRDGRLELDHRTGGLLGVEARVFPTRLGLYAAGGVAHARPTKYQLSFVRNGPTARYGSNSYASNLTASWRDRPHTVPSLGLGYSPRPRNGWLGTIGLTVPLSFPRRDGLRLSFDSGANVQLTDQAAVRRNLDREIFYGPIAIHIGVGRSFTLP